MASPTTPTLVAPIGGIRITDNTPTLSFVIPSDADNDKLTFMVEVDTHDPIQTGSSDYLKYESRLGQGNFQYEGNAGFIDVPTAGIGTVAYGKTGIATIPAPNKLRNSIWYWKISVSDQLSCGKFGTTATFAQRIFCGA